MRRPGRIVASLGRPAPAAVRHCDDRNQRTGSFRASRRVSRHRLQSRRGSIWSSRPSDKSRRRKNPRTRRRRRTTRGSVLETWACKTPNRMRRRARSRASDAGPVREKNNPRTGPTAQRQKRSRVPEGMQKTPEEALIEAKIAYASCHQGSARGRVETFGNGVAPTRTRRKEPPSRRSEVRNPTSPPRFSASCETRTGNQRERPDRPARLPYALS